MDNLSVHKASVSVIEIVLAAQGATMAWVPPYSPDLSPIELCWSKAKESLRTAAARGFDALIGAVKEALESITPEQARHWFHHCGFCIEPG